MNIETLNVRNAYEKSGSSIGSTCEFTSKCAEEIALK